MSNGIQLYSKGGNFSIKAQALDIVSATGVFTNNSLPQQVFNGRLVGHNEALELRDDEASPTDCPSPDPVTYETVFRFTVDEFEHLYALGDTANDSKLDELITASFYARFLIDKYSNANPARTGATGFLRRMIVYAKFVGFGRDAPKEKTKLSANFQAVPIPDGSGGYKVNPYFTSNSATVDIP